jgi:hypothetical protein
MFKHALKKISLWEEFSKGFLFLPSCAGCFFRGALFQALPVVLRTNLNSRVELAGHQPAEGCR